MKKTIILLSICLLTLSNSLSAQEATLDETIGFISRKLQTKMLTYGEGVGIKAAFLDLSEAKLNYNTILFSSSRISDYVHLDYSRYYIHVKLTSVETIETIEEMDSGGYSKIVMKSTKPFVFYSYKNDIYDLFNVEMPYRLEIVGVFSNEDVSRVLKAFQHLFKLLDIKLVEEKF